jgi:hypothetical protein
MFLREAVQNPVRQPAAMRRNVVRESVESASRGPWSADTTSPMSRIGGRLQQFGRFRFPAMAVNSPAPCGFLQSPQLFSRDAATPKPFRFLVPLVANFCGSAGNLPRVGNGILSHGYTWTAVAPGCVA